jgi:hypothetical protein
VFVRVDRVTDNTIHRPASQEELPPRRSSKAASMPRQSAVGRSCEAAPQPCSRGHSRRALSSQNSLRVLVMCSDHGPIRVLKSWVARCARFHRRFCYDHNNPQSRLSPNLVAAPTGMACPFILEIIAEAIPDRKKNVRSARLDLCRTVSFCASPVPHRRNVV